MIFMPALDSEPGKQSEIKHPYPNNLEGWSHGHSGRKDIFLMQLLRSAKGGQLPFPTLILLRLERGIGNTPNEGPHLCRPSGGNPGVFLQT